MHLPLIVLSLSQHLGKNNSAHQPLWGTHAQLGASAPLGLLACLQLQ